MDLTAPASTARDGRPLHKGQQTRSAILDAALALASQMGLEGLSIGALADHTGIANASSVRPSVVVTSHRLKIGK